MFKKILLILAVAVLIAAGVVWSIRIFRAKKPVLLYTALSRQKSPEPRTNDAIKPDIPEVEASIVAAAIYQNGISSVIRCANPGAVPEFLVAGNFVPLNGSIAFGSEIREVKKVRFQEEAPLYYPADNLTKSFAGKLVTLRVSDGTGESEISGTVIDPEPKKQNAEKENFVTLKLANRRHTMIRRDLIQRVDVEKVQPVISGVQQNSRFCWLFTAAKPLNEPVRFQYLTRNLNWNASLHLYLAGDAMAAELNAEIVNQLDDFEGVPLILASGAPQFEDETDPMALFDLNLRKRNEPAFAAMMMNKAAMAEDFSMGAAAPGTQNIRYFPAGQVTMKKGEVLLRKLGAAQGKCERIVIWRISQHQEGRAMEALRFVNPFAFPVPEATILVSRLGSAPFAQVKSKWLNVGEKRTIDLIEAPSVSVKRDEKEIASELEAPGKEKRRYRLCTMEDVLTIKNYQSSVVKMAVEHRFYGKLLAADGKPEISGFAARREIDPGCKLTWEFSLAPGEEKKISFRYQQHVQF